MSLPPPRTTELFYGGQWNNISGDMRESDPVTITRGVSSEGNRTDPGAATATLNNRHGRYSPRDPLSDLYGEIGRNTGWRFSVRAGGPHLACPAGIYSISTPDGPGLDILGDIDVRLDAALDTWLSPQMLAIRWAPGGHLHWALELGQNGRLYVVWSPTGAPAATRYARATAPVPAYPGQRLVVRATLDVDNGNTGCTTTFFTGPTMDGPWTALGAPVVSAVTTSLFNASAPLYIGDNVVSLTPDGTSGLDRLRGRVYGLRVYNGIDGALVVDADPVTQAAAGATSWTDATGHAWTLSGTAALSNRHTRMVGEVPAWPPSRDLSGADVTTAIAPAGIMRRLGSGNKPLDSALRRFIQRAPGLLECWPLTDGAQATQGASLLGSRPAMPVASGADPEWARGELGDWIEPVAHFPTGSFGTLNMTPPAASSAGWSVDVFRAGRGVNEWIEVQDLGRGTDTDPRNTWLLLMQTEFDHILIFRESQSGDSSSTAFLGTVTAPGIYDERPHHIRISTTVSPGNTAWTLYIDGTPVTGGVEEVTGKGIGRVGLLWDLTNSSDTLSAGYVTCWGPSGPTAAATYQAYMGFPGEPAGGRVLRLAAEQGIPAYLMGPPDEDTPLGIQKPAKLLDAFASIAETDLGYMLEQRDATALVYRSRTTLYNQPPAFVLNFAAGLVSAPFRPIDDDKLTENDITVQRDGGGFSNAVLDSGRMSVLDPPAGVGRYDISRTLSLAADDQTADHAWWRLHLGTYDGLRYTRITVDLGNPRAYALVNAIYRADVGDLIRLTGLPADHGPDDVDLIIRGYTEEISATRWTITFNCAPGQPWAVGIVDDPDYGRADTDGSELAAPADADDTTLMVTATAGPRWTTDPADMPMDIRAGGEVMTVSRITAQIEDTFDRTVTNGWGTATSGHTWTTTGGTAANYSVQGA
ncbi:hypothetical protein [Streptomyces odonnellii]|uniref:hypothetical protein n=1 Tax=Streptomyces odonnellii TaxID=1417980 RepID=UPI0012FF3A42|nr:hypothetical protein [Streptomyces odonnellii]